MTLPQPRIEPLDDVNVQIVAEHRVTGRITGAAPLDGDGGKVEVLRVALRYTCDPLSSAWKPAVADLMVRLVDLPDAPRTTLLLGADQSPPWLAELVARFTPTARLVVDVPGRDGVGDLPPTEHRAAVTCHDVRFDVVHATSEITCRVTDVGVRDAPVERLEGGVVGADRYLRPDTLAVTYMWGLRGGDVDQWIVDQITATGPATDPDGTPLPDTAGTLRCATPPPWAMRWARENLPVHVGLTRRESDADEALRLYRTLAGLRDRLAARVAATDMNRDGIRPALELQDRLDVATESAENAAASLVALLDRGAELPGPWRGNPMPDDAPDGDGEAHGWTLNITTPHSRAREITLAAARSLTLALGPGSQTSVADPDGDEIGWVVYDRDGEADTAPPTA